MAGRASHSDRLDRWDSCGRISRRNLCNRAAPIGHSPTGKRVGLGHTAARTACIQRSLVSAQTGPSRLPELPRIWLGARRPAVEFEPHRSATTSIDWTVPLSLVEGKHFEPESSGRTRFLTARTVSRSRSCRCQRSPCDTPRLGICPGVWRNDLAYDNTGLPQFFLGGVGQLNAYGTTELRTDQYFLFRAGSLHELWTPPPLVRNKVYVISTYEIGKAYAAPAASLFSLSSNHPTDSCVRDGHTARTAGDRRKRWRHRPSKVVLPVRTNFLSARRASIYAFSF
jgi:hypothetical protein